MKISKPSLREGGWDCHAHLFGPYQDFPLASDRSYSPPEAKLESYLDHLSLLGLAKGVLVHPSAYANDHSLLFSVLARHPQLRGVAVVNPRELKSLLKDKPEGLRAARFSHRSGLGANFAGSASISDLMSMAPDLADAGMHAELWTDCLALPGISDVLTRLPLPVVIDHMGGFDAQAGIEAPGFRQLLQLLEQGKVWIKLCAYRNLMIDGLFSEATLEAGLPFHRALVRTNPERLLWGSDWPHLRVDPVPDAGRLLVRFERWTDSDDLVQKILRDNPEQLYG